jgi:Xaa-Pro aminopeptidase
MSDKRIDALRKILAEQQINAAVLLYSRDLLYYAGVSIPSILLITPQTSRLFIRRAMEFAVADSTVMDVEPDGSLRKIAEQLKEEKLQRTRIGLELDVIPAELYLRLQSELPDAQFVNISPHILNQRMVKDEDELKLVRISAEMTDKAHRRAQEVIRGGMPEIAMAAEIEAELRRNKHEVILINRRFDAHTMYGMIGSGENLARFAGFANVASGIGLSRAMRISASDRIMNRGDVVMIDITGCYHGYITDVTRMYVIGGASKKQREVFDELCLVQDEIFSNIRPGVPVSEVYERGLSAAAKSNYSDYFMGYHEKGKFVGHGIGLELDEPPVIGPDDPTIIRENMTLVIEINTIIPGFGAIKVEDSFIVHSDGIEILSNIERRLYEVDV